jgi:hypothetical protein
LYKDRKGFIARLSKTLQSFKLLYEALNGLIDTKVSWESFKDRRL